MAEPDQSLSLTYAGLVDEMRRWHAEKRSGTMLVATEDNHLAKILFDNGEIAHLAYGLKSGREAIPLLKQIGHARLRVSPGRGGAHPVEGALPPTAEIMALLAATTAAPAAQPPAGAPLDDEHLAKALNVIETELIEHLGPLANIVWAEQLERLGKPVSARHLPELVERLAREIGDPAKVQRFKDEIRKKTSRA